MQLLNPYLERLPEGGTLVTCEVRVDAGRETYTRELRFIARLELALVERLIAEVGAELAVWMLWTHFRRITTTPMAVDSERASLEDWAIAVDILLAEVKRATGPCSEGQAGA
jgi:hypothetical protein